MSKHWRLEKPQNDVNKIPTYAPGTPERAQLLKEIEALKRTTEEIPLIINGEPVKTGQTVDVVCPHDHKRVLARAHLAGESELRRAIDAALEAHKTWSALDGYDRAAIFMRAADLLAGPRRIQNIAAIMLNQSKTPFEAEIDLAELVDFWRFNAYYMQFLYEQQPDQISGEINRFDWRPLEGFILAVPPFNFYSIGGNLPTAPALVGNVALWKPARSVLLSNYRIMQILIEAGLPKGVISFVPFSSQYSDVVLKHPVFRRAALHGQLRDADSLMERRSARTCPNIEISQESSARPVEKTSSSCTHRPILTSSLRTPSVGRLNIKDRSARRRRECTSPRASGPPSRSAFSKNSPRSRSAPPKTSRSSWARSLQKTRSIRSSLISKKPRRTQTLTRSSPAGSTTAPQDGSSSPR
jgi:hypothetical protein